MKWLLHDIAHLPFPLSASVPWLGASVAAFVVAFALQGAEALVARASLDARATRCGLDELLEHARGRAPHHVAVDVVGRHRELAPSRSRTSSRRRDGSAKISSGGEKTWSTSRHVVDELVRMRDLRDERPHQEPGDERRQVVQDAEHSDVGRVEPDLLVRLAQRGALERRVGGLEAAAREGHLALVRPDVVRALGQHDVEHVLPDEQRDRGRPPDGSRPRIGEPSSDGSVRSSSSRASGPNADLIEPASAPAVTTPVRPSSRPRGAVRAWARRSCGLSPPQMP